MTNKHFYNYELLTIKGNIGSDITLKTKQKERLEFQVAVNKYDKKTKTKTKTAKWFKVVVFNDEILTAIKSCPMLYKRGTNVAIEGEITAEVYNGKSTLKIIARKVSLNTKES
jgi:single-stranded DNA-binding protein